MRGRENERINLFYSAGNQNCCAVIELDYTEISGQAYYASNAKNICDSLSVHLAVLM